MIVELFPVVRSVSQKYRLPTYPIGQEAVSIAKRHELALGSEEPNGFRLGMHTKLELLHPSTRAKHCHRCF